MEKATTIAEFFKAIEGDNRIGPMHISLYMALVYLNELQKADGVLYIFSNDAMPFAKYSSVTTYHKCIRDLHNFGYIKYIPSYNHFLGSLIYLQKQSR